MSNQVKLDMAVSEVLHNAAKDGAPYLRVGDGIWQYRDNSWSPVGSRAHYDLERAALTACEGAGVAYTEKVKAFQHTMMLRTEYHSEDEFDREPAVVFDNGVFFPKSMEFHQPSPDIRVTRRVAVAFEEGATCPEWLAALDRAMSDKKPNEREAAKLFLQEWFGMALVGFNPHTPRALRKLLLLEGLPGTAKTQIAEVARRLFGEENSAKGDLKFITSRFGTYGLVGAKAWIADDAIGKDDKVNSSTLKKVITGEPMQADRKNLQAVSFRFQSPCLITTNNLPKIDDSSHALYGRVVMIRLNRQFTNADAKVDLKGRGSLVAHLEAEGELSGIVNWSLAGALRALDAGKFTDLDENYDSSMAWRKANDPLFSFICDHCSFDAGVYNYSSALTYMASIYAEMEYSKKMSPAYVRQLLPRELPSVVHGLTQEKVRYQGGDTQIWKGLRVTEDAKRWLEVAREKGITPQKSVWPVNQRTM
jgi:P4 family phage/plasmid primase-like protien